MNFYKIMFFLAACLGVVTVTQPVGAIRAANSALPKEVNKSIKNRILELEKQKRSPETLFRTNSMINIANRLKLKRKKQNQEIVIVDFCGTATKAVRNGKCYLCKLEDPQNEWRFNKLWEQSPDLLKRMSYARLKANQDKIDQLKPSVYREVANTNQSNRNLNHVSGVAATQTATLQNLQNEFNQL